MYDESQGGQKSEVTIWIVVPTVSLDSQWYPWTHTVVLSPQDFDRLLEALRAALTKDPGTGFVFSCLSGQGQTTTAMVVAVLACWHIGVGVAFCVRSEVSPGRGGY